jgi:glycosyltransferase involved in cell wall biosynthesis
VSTATLLESSTSSPRRYLMVINEIAFVYSHFWGLVESVQRAGFEVTIAARSSANPQRAIDAGMKFIPLDLKVGLGNPVAELRSMMELRRTIRACSPDVLHLVSLKNVLLGGFLARNLKQTSVLGAVTGLGSMFVEEKLIYSILRPLVMSGLKTVFANPRSVMALENADDRDFFVDSKVVPSQRTFLIPGAGLEANAILPTQHLQGPPKVLCVSRMIRNKGIPQLIEASRILKREGLDFEVWLVGDADANNPTSMTPAELHAAEQEKLIKWLGRRSDVAELLKEANIFCLATYYREGLPRSLVEASAAGRAIVTTDVPGCREVVIHGLNGLLVSPRDSVGLANALRELILDPERCTRMGVEARRRFEQRFTQDSVLAAFSKCYEALDLPLEVSSS